MKKILFILITCLGLVSCGYSQKELEEINSYGIQQCVLSACIADLKDKLKDPFSLKIDGPIFLSTIITDPAAAAKSTKIYGEWVELYNNKYSDKKSIKKHMDEIVDEFVNMGNNTVYGKKTPLFYVISFKYYARNGYGAYVSDYAKYIVAITNYRTNKDGVYVLGGVAFEASWDDKFSKGYTAEICVSDGRGVIEIPEQYKTN